jgi:transcriptional regulator with XRE-family HTH domain
MKKTLHEIVAHNLKRLKEHANLSQEEIAAKTGLAQRTISNALNPGSTKSITTTTIDELAAYFKIEPYHLLIPNLPTEELLSLRLEHVIRCYSQSNIEARENISRIAENEMRYCINGKTNDYS